MEEDGKGDLAERYRVGGLVRNAVFRYQDGEIGEGFAWGSAVGSLINGHRIVLAYTG